MTGARGIRYLIVNADDLGASPRGEFSCAKPSCLRFHARISDCALCYLASGKPAVVQHTGPSRFLPNGEGLFGCSSAC